ncbi:hypothetical protein EES41_36010 [Streptomyces sp. ADI95-16]|nr:hypothetical protein EES41_36010 [Streptomyces sp. ADI95-16]
MARWLPTQPVMWPKEGSGVMDMVGMAAALVATHATAVGSLDLPAPVQLVAAVVAGFGIGLVAAIMGVAGG